MTGFLEIFPSFHCLNLNLRESLNLAGKEIRPIDSAKQQYPAIESPEPRYQYSDSSGPLRIPQE